MKIVILYSGGVDSYTLYHYIKNTYPRARVKALYYDFGQPYKDWEIKNLPEFVEVRTVEWLQHDHTVHVDPNKNGIMWGREQFLTVHAYMQEKPDMICLGVLKDEMAEDMSEWHKNMTQLFLGSLNPWNITPEVTYPFAEQGWGKYEVVKWALEHNLDVMGTVTCMISEQPCKECIGCAQRDLVFCSHGLIEEVFVSEQMFDKLIMKGYTSVISDLLESGQFRVYQHGSDGSQRIELPLRRLEEIVRESLEKTQAYQS